MTGFDLLVKNYKIFTDTTSLIHPRSTHFFLALRPYLTKYGTKIIIPQKVIEELETNEKSTNPDKRKRAMNALRFLKTLKNYVEIRGEKGDPAVLDLFLHLFNRFRDTYNLCLFTQDVDMATKILALKKTKGKYNIVVIILNANGRPVNFEDYDDLTRTTSALGSFPEPVTKFKLCRKPLTRSPRQLSISHIPKRGDQIVTKRYGTFKLLSELGSGGEGSIYLANNDLICKVYKKVKITEMKRKKIEKMLTNIIDYPGICWPRDIALNCKGEFVGYIMKKAEGKEMQKAMFIKQLLMKNFPNWKKRHLVTLSINILKRIDYLHKRNVIIGDLNPLNILIKDENVVYFVDTDSYQIEDFPCPVGTVNFTAPNIQGKDFKTFLRTFEEEYFAVATLLFMTLLPGKPPYSQQGGSNPSLNIKRQDFSYPLGKMSNKRTPPGQWRYIWSHLPYYLKKQFYGIFKEGNRISASDWLQLMVRYKSDLEKGHVTDVLFPNEFKKVELENVRCSRCGDVEERSKYHITKRKKESKGGYVCDDCFAKYK